MSIKRIYISFSKIRSRKYYILGITIIELMIALMVVGILSMVAVPAYQDYGKRVESQEALQDIITIQYTIKNFEIDNSGTLPNSLADIGMDSMRDPWGNPYEYLNYGTNPPGARRKDKNLNPLNSDYDLYSKGEDGQSNKQIITKKSKDDIIRGRDGSFIGFAEDF